MKQPASERELLERVEELRLEGSLQEALCMVLDSWSPDSSEDLRAVAQELRAEAPRALWCSPSMGINGLVSCIAVARDGSRAAIASLPGVFGESVLVRSLSTGAMEWIPSDGYAVALAFHPAGHTLALLGASGDLSLIRLADGARSRVARFAAEEAELDDGHTRLSWTPCGSVIAVGLSEGTLLRCSPDGVELPRPDGRWLAFSFEGTALIAEPRAHSGPSGGESRWVERDVVSLEELRSYLPPAQSPSFPMAFQGERFAHVRRFPGEQRWQVCVWDLARREDVVAFQADAHSLALSPGGRFLATAGLDAVNGWDLSSRSRTFSKAGSHAELLAFADGTHFVLSGYNDRALQMFEASTGAETLRTEGHVAEVQAACFSPDGRQVASVSQDGTARVWCAKTGAELSRFASCGACSIVAYLPSGRLVFVNNEGVVSAGLVSSGLVEGMIDVRCHVSLFSAGTSVIRGVLSSDGERLCSLTASDDQTLRLWAMPGAMHWDKEPRSTLSPESLDRWKIETSLRVSDGRCWVRPVPGSAYADTEIAEYCVP